MALLDPQTLFAPVRAVEIETARGLGEFRHTESLILLLSRHYRYLRVDIAAKRVVVTFQQTLDFRLAQIEVPINFIIVNWKKLSGNACRVCAIWMRCN